MQHQSKLIFSIHPAHANKRKKNLSLEILITGLNKQTVEPHYTMHIQSIFPNAECKHEKK
jgi:hypothetical protein